MQRKPRIGIALGSGVGRGWAHLGVLRALESAGVKPDIIAGTSIGALVGGAYTAGHAAELEARARALTKGRITRFFDFQLGGGVIAGRRIARILHPDLHVLTIEELDRPFVAVATDLASGQEIWLRQGNLVAAIRASYAVPGLFAPVRSDGRWLIDGALTNPVPVSVCRALGADLTIAVSLTMDRFDESPVAEDDETLQMIDAEAAEPKRRKGLGIGRVRRLLAPRREDPSVFTVVGRALIIGQDRIARSRLAGDPPDILIAPKVGGIGLFAFDRAADSIAAGEAAANAALPEIHAALRQYAGGLPRRGRRREPP